MASKIDKDELAKLAVDQETLLNLIQKMKGRLSEQNSDISSEDFNEIEELAEEVDQKMVELASIVVEDRNQQEFFSPSVRAVTPNEQPEQQEFSSLPYRTRSIKERASNPPVPRLIDPEESSSASSATFPPLEQQEFFDNSDQLLTAEPLPRPLSIETFKSSGIDIPTARDFAVVSDSIQIPDEIENLIQLHLPEPVPHPLLSYQTQEFSILGEPIQTGHLLLSGIEKFSRGIATDAIDENTKSEVERPDNKKTGEQIARAWPATMSKKAILLDLNVRRKEEFWNGVRAARRLTEFAEDSLKRIKDIEIKFKSPSIYRPKESGLYRPRKIVQQVEVIKEETTDKSEEPKSAGWMEMLGLPQSLATFTTIPDKQNDPIPEPINKGAGSFASSVIAVIKIQRFYREFKSKWADKAVIEGFTHLPSARQRARVRKEKSNMH